MVRKECEKYDFIVSLGAVCSCSAALRSRNLQDYSYPFDWVGGSSLKERIYIVINSFKGWFEKEDFKYEGQRTSPAPCNIYRNQKTDIVYNHDFVLDLPIDATYDEVKEQYKRREKRMLDKIDEAKSVCFVYIDSAEVDTPYSEEYLKECWEILNNHFKNKDITLKYIFNSKEFAYKKTDKIQIITDDYSVKTPQAEKYEADVKVLSNLFKNVRLKRKWTLKRVLNIFYSCKVTKRANWKRYQVKILFLKFQYTKNIKFKGAKNA